MKDNITKETMMTASQTLRHLGLYLAAALVTLACMPASAWDDRGRADDYQQVNLVSDLPGVAILQDTNLVNAWGMSFSSTSPFWISDNGSGLSTLYAVTYDTNGVVQVAKQGLEVGIPGEGNPTGQLFNGTGEDHRQGCLPQVRRISPERSLAPRRCTKLSGICPDSGQTRSDGGHSGQHRM